MWRLSTKPCIYCNKPYYKKHFRSTACAIPMHVDCNLTNGIYPKYAVWLALYPCMQIATRMLAERSLDSILALYPCMQIATQLIYVPLSHITLALYPCMQIATATAKTQIQTAYGINIVCVNLIECIHYTKKLRFYNVLSRFTDAKPPGLNVNYTFALNLYYNTA